MWIATNRQKKNAFAKRADMKRKAEEPPAKPAPVATPTPVAGPKPDLEAMKAAAAEAAALVHANTPADDLTERLQGAGTLEVPDSLMVDGIEEHTEALDAIVSEAVAEPEQVRRGRPMSAAVAKRNASILQLLAENPEGLSRAQLAEEVKEKEANVYTSLRRLQSDGKVRVENTEGTKYLWYLA